MCILYSSESQVQDFLIPHECRIYLNMENNIFEELGALELQQILSNSSSLC